MSALLVENTLIEGQTKTTAELFQFETELKLIPICMAAFFAKVQISFSGIGRKGLEMKNQKICALLRLRGEWSLVLGTHDLVRALPSSGLERKEKQKISYQHRGCPYLGLQPISLHSQVFKRTLKRLDHYILPIKTKQ